MTPVPIVFRIPGRWAGPGDLIDRLPEGYSLSPESLALPDSTQVEFSAVPADGEFASIFRASCRKRPTAQELASVASYTVNVLLSGPGGSLAAALRMMRAAAAVVRAGGAGVFIDNSALAHGGGDWLAMTEDGGSDAVSFAFVALVGGRGEVWTMGMHVLGLRELTAKAADMSDDFDLSDVIRYLARGEKPVDDGHLFADLDGPRFRAVFTSTGGPELPPDGPMHNPFGRLLLVSMKDEAESN